MLGFTTVRGAPCKCASGWEVLPCRCFSCQEESDSLLLCASCQQAKYCSKECQKKHWKKQHKMECEEASIELPRIISQEEDVGDEGESA